MQKQIDADGGKITMKSLRLGVEGGLIDQGKLVEGANEMADKMGSMSGSIVTQRAVTYVQEAVSYTHLRRCWRCRPGHRGTGAWKPKTAKRWRRGYRACAWG